MLMQRLKKTVGHRFIKWLVEFSPEKLCLLLVHTRVLLMQEGHQAVAWRPHPSLFQLKLVPTADFSICDDQLLTLDPLVDRFDLHNHMFLLITVQHFCHAHVITT